MTQFRHIPVEKVKEFWDRRPCNIRHSPKPVRTREYFCEVVDCKYFVEPHIPRFAESHAGGARGCWKLNAASAPSPLTSPGMVLP